MILIAQEFVHWCTRFIAKKKITLKLLFLRRGKLDGFCVIEKLILGMIYYAIFYLRFVKQKKIRKLGRNSLKLF